MTGPDLQAAILSHLRQLVPKEKNLAAELANALGIATNAAYKRIEGRTAFTIHDLARLSQHFPLPWHRIFQQGQTGFQIEFSGFVAQRSCVEYLTLLEWELAALRNAPSPEIWFLTVGLPDFHLFHFEDLALFQLYFWERISWGNPAWQDRKFRFEVENKQELSALTKRIVHHYMHIPTFEFWNEHVLDSFLHQLVYAYESKLFEQAADFRRLLSQLHQLINHLESMASKDVRFVPGGATVDRPAPWSLFYNETMRNNILLLVKTGDSETFYAVVNNPHFVRSNDPGMVAYAKDVFSLKMERSQPLGKAGEKYRGGFFDKLRRQVEQAGQGSAI